MSDQLPVPRYKIGDVVWHGSLTSTIKKLPCPDCLGTMTWRCISPAGTGFTVARQRCCDRYTHENIPSLEYREWVPQARMLTIGKITVRTGPHDDWNHPVECMCHETGIGSGQNYREDRLFLTEAEALADQVPRATEKNLETNGTTQRLAERRLSHLKVVDARFEAATSAVWSSHYRFNNLRDEIKNIIEPPENECDCNPRNTQEKLEAIMELAEGGYEWTHTPPLGELVAAVEELITAPDHLVAEAQAREKVVKVLTEYFSWVSCEKQDKKEDVS